MTAEVIKAKLGMPQVPALSICEVKGDSCTLPSDIRKKWLNDPVRSPEWRTLLREFDALFGEPVLVATHQPQKEHASAVSSEANVVKDDWVGEPTTADDLSKKYPKVLKTFPASTDAASFVIVDAKTSGEGEGEAAQTTDYDFKLFIVGREAVTLSDKEVLLSYGTAQFVRPNRVNKVLESGRACPHCLQCLARKTLGDVLGSIPNP